MTEIPEHLRRKAEEARERAQFVGMLQEDPWQDVARPEKDDPPEDLWEGFGQPDHNFGSGAQPEPKEGNSMTMPPPPPGDPFDDLRQEVLQELRAHQQTVIARMDALREDFMPRAEQEEAVREAAVQIRQETGLRRTNRFVAFAFVAIIVLALFTHYGWRGFTDNKGSGLSSNQVEVIVNQIYDAKKFQECVDEVNADNEAFDTNQVPEEVCKKK